MMSWVHWLHKLGDIEFKASSLPALATMPLFYGLGYLNHNESLRVQLILHLVSVLIAGDTYMYEMLAVYPLFKGLDGVKELSRVEGFALAGAHVLLYLFMDHRSRN
jgi:hypothetical protein